MSWERLNLAAPEFAKPSEPPKLCGLVYAGRRHLVSGPPEALKTMFALIIGLELLRSTDETFALIDFESGPYGTRRMLDDLGATLDEIGRVYYVEPDLAPLDDNISALVDANVSLAIIDAVVGAYGVSGLDDNARKDAETFGAAWVDPLWRAGVGTLLIDHVVKNSESRGRFAIGSERKAGRTDVHLGLDAKVQLSRGKTGIVSIATHKDRPGWLPRPHAADLELRSDPASHRVAWTFTAASTDTGDGETRDSFRPTVLMERVSAYLERQTEPVSRNTICRDVTGKRAYVLQAIDVLIEDGHATADDTRRVSHLSRFPVPEVVPGGSRNQDTGPVPGSLPLQGGTGTGTTPGTTNGADGSRDELDRLLADHADIANPQPRVSPNGTASPESIP